MWYYYTSALVNGLTLTILGIIVCLKGRQKSTKITYVTFCFFISLWSYSYFLWQVSNTAGAALFWCRVLTIGSIFIPASYFNFCIHLLGLQKKKRAIVYSGYFLAFLFFIFNFTPLMVLSVTQKMNFTYWPVAGPIYGPFLFYFVVYAIYALVLLFKQFVLSTGAKRNQLKYVLIGSILGYIGGGSNFPLWFGIRLAPVGNILISVYVALVGYAIVKYRLLDIRVFITRALAFLVSYPLLLGVPFFFAYRMYPVLYPLMGMNWWLVPAGLISTFATLAPLAYSQFKHQIENTLLAEQKRYQKLLLQAASGMAGEHNLSRLAKLIVYIVKRVVKIDFAAIFLDDPEHKAYTLKATRGNKLLLEEVTFLYEHPLIDYLKKNKAPFLYEEAPFRLRNSLNFPQQTSLVVPSFVEDSLLGFVFLGEKANRQSYTEDDINVFKILSHQAALSIKNSLFIQESKQAQERIFAAEKLASIGGMADGVAHQIKNRLNQFSVASGELKYEVKDFISSHKELVDKNPDLKKSLKYIIKIGESLISNVKKTDGIVKGILQFARVEEKENFFSDFALGEVVDLSEELLKIKHEIAKSPLSINLGKVNLVYGVKAQITETIYNIIDNAYEAILEKKLHLNPEEKKNFTPFIGVNLIQKPKLSLIKISDNGMGIKKEDQQKIFAPFFTTKSSYKSGSGIGMYVVKRMVEENHKGRVWFETEYAQGTNFFIELPRKKYHNIGETLIV